jgi:glycosyltransferase involved in cell wall biosynthesis
MRVAHYNTFADGGAGILMRRLHGALRELGHDSRIRFRKGNLDSPDAARLEFCRSWLDRQRERVRQRFETFALRPDAPSFFGRYRSPQPTPPPPDDATADIVHLHWVSQWLDLPSFLAGLPPRVPIVWTIHDMSALAGGCFLDFGCDQFANQCEVCPLFKPPFDKKFAAREWQHRSDALAGRKIFAVANSAFTAGLVKKSPLFAGVKKIAMIHPALKMDEFTRHEKTAARKQLGIAPDKFVLGFGAAALTDINKGFNRFWEVAEKTGQKLGGVTALVFGDGLPTVSSARVKIHSLGKLSAPAQLSLAYSAMDIFVLASQMETFGQVAAEAQLCGTPVWAFDVGGLRDAVQPGVTGNLVPFADTGRMAEEICAQFRAGNLPAMGERAAAWVRETFPVKKMAEQYLQLYREALATK